MYYPLSISLSPRRRGLRPPPTSPPFQPLPRRSSWVLHCIYTCESWQVGGWGGDRPVWNPKWLRNHGHLVPHQRGRHVVTSTADAELNTRTGGPEGSVHPPAYSSALRDAYSKRCEGFASGYDHSLYGKISLRPPENGPLRRR